MTFIKKINGKEVSDKEWEAACRKMRRERAKYSKWKRPFYRLSNSDSGDFRGEIDPVTGKQGRYMPQYGNRNDPRAVFLSVADAKKEAARRGWQVVG